jgi:diguanylate cyclase (GGDEF)-like protein/PAS domain S-box-containing protein
MSGDAALLAERDAAIDKRERVLPVIQQLTADNPTQRARWVELREVIAERLALARKVEALRKSQGQAAANEFVATAPLKETRTRTHRLLDAMEQDELLLLDARSAEQQRMGQLLRAAGVSVALLLLAILAASYVLIRRQLREAEASRLELEDSEQRLSITLRSIGDAVMATDVDGCITRMNPVAERITGWRFDDVGGRHVDEVFRIADEATHARVAAPIGRLLAGGEAVADERHLVLLARDDSECPISLSAAPKRGVDGRLRGAVLVFRDVSVERQAQRTVEAQNEWLAERVRERTAQLQQSESHLQSVTSNVPAMIAYVDAGQRYVYCNQQYRERFAPDRRDIVGRSVAEILGEERYAIAAPLIAKVLRGEPQTYDWQPFPGVWQVVSYVPQRDALRKVVGYYVLGSDITERKQAEERIQTLNVELEHRVRDLERVSRALRTLSAGNRTMLRATDEAELLQAMCNAIVDTGGYGMGVIWYRVDDDAKTLQPMAECGYPGGLAALRLLKVSWAEGEHGGGAVAASVRSGTSSVVADMGLDPAYAPWRHHLAGHRSALACPLTVHGETIGALNIYDAEPDTFDADEVALLTESADDLAFGIATLRSRAEQDGVRAEMDRLTRQDALTGLPNEARFAQAVGAAIERGEQTGQPFAALQANIDRLREVNDALGFLHGDQMLREFAARLRAAAPEDAVVARLRGDEFAILLPGGGRGDANALLQRLEAHLAEPFFIADLPLDMSFRAGITLFPDHGATPHDVFRHMDIAVHQAKRRGARHAFFDPVLNQDHPGRLNMASELKRAIHGDELQVYLQPKIEMSTGRVCGAVALVRWKHPERGLVPPGEFIELAEQTGLIKPLTEWMLASVLRLNQAWAGTGQALPIAVNLSARNLRDDDLLARIRHLLDLHQTAPGLLELEITESTVMDDAQFSLRVLRELRDQGIPLYIDDFGTGYSSLSYLQRLPVEFVKIDQSFIRDMSASKDSAAIVRSTIELAHELGRKLVAEGIETLAHWHQLVELGCDFGQGYFIARPMPAAEFQGWLQGYVPPPPPPRAHERAPSGG